MHLWPSYFIFKYITLQDSCTWKSPLIIKATLCVAVNKWKQPKWLSIGDKKQLWSISTTEYYLAVKWWTKSTHVNMDKLYNINLKCCSRIHYDSNWDRLYIYDNLYKVLIINIFNTKYISQTYQSMQRKNIWYLDHSYLAEKEKRMQLRRSTKGESTKSIKFCLKNKTTWIIIIKC